MKNVDTKALQPLPVSLAESTDGSVQPVIHLTIMQLLKQTETND